MASQNPTDSFRPVAVERIEDRLLFAADCARIFTDSDYEVVAQSLADADPLNGISVREQYGFDGYGQTVVVIDSGVAYDHYALGGGFGTNYRVVGGWDFAENDANPYDDAPGGLHGTHVAGIIASDDTNHPGLATGVDIVALRVFNDSGYSELRWIEQALDWVHAHQYSFEHPITTVNLSISYNPLAGNSVVTTLDDELATGTTLGLDAG